MIPTGWWTSIDRTLNAAPFFCGVFTSICSHAHLPAQMRRKGRQIRCCRSSIVPTSTSLKLWRFDCLETRSACQKALCRPRKSTLSPHSQLVRFDMPVWQNTAPANKKSSARAGEAQENARRHRQSAAPATKFKPRVRFWPPRVRLRSSPKCHACHVLAWFAFGFDPLYFKGTLTFRVRFRPSGRVRFRPPAPWNKRRLIIWSPHEWESGFN